VGNQVFLILLVFLGYGKDCLHIVIYSWVDFLPSEALTLENLCFPCPPDEHLYYFDHESTQNCKSTSTLCQFFLPLFSTCQGLVFSKKLFISNVASLNCASSGMNSKSLMNFSFISVQLNVWPHASSILYHLCGISSKVFGNMCGQTLSSLYPTLLHSFSH
jgi:hypothetical protein